MIQKGSLATERLSNGKKFDLFSVKVMSGYINNMLNSTNDDFIRQKHKTYKDLELKKHVQTKDEIVFKRLYKAPEKQ